jgi:NAD(P)-dependent dehydrogenase (short-subunit alcohol dehydrogenase family)
MANRSTEKSEAAIKNLKGDTGKDAIFLKLDLASLKSVKAAAEEFNRSISYATPSYFQHLMCVLCSKENELHVLFNNGGVMVPPIEQLTEDGYDLQFGTNVLGHYYFTMLLLPALLAGTKTSGDGKARVVNTSSSVHMFSNMNFDTFTDGPARKKAGTQKLYSQSKHVRTICLARVQICLIYWY